MSADQIIEPNIKLIFELLVMQHPSYSKFVIDEDWAWAQKIASDRKTLELIISRSWKYRVLKKLKAVLSRA